MESPAGRYLLRKGQVTVYLILAIFVIIVSLSIWQTQRIEPTAPAVTSIGEPGTMAREVITTCLTHSLEDSITNLGKAGNADAPPKDRVFLKDHSVAILYNRRNILLPSLAQYGTQIGDGAIKPLRDCMALTGKLPYNLVVDYDAMAVSVAFDDLNTILTADIPATVTSGKATTTLHSFEAKTPVAFKKVHTFMSDYLDEVSKDPFIVPFTPLLNQDILASLYPIDNHTFLVRLTDPDSSIRNKPWIITFAVDYTEVDR